MSLTAQQQLIYDTLHYQRPAGQGSFFVNEPGLKLISSDESYFPAIKAAILEASQQTGDPRQIFGLDYVIGAFLVVGTKYVPQELIPFIRALPKGFIEEVVRGIPAYFLKLQNTGKYILGVAPPHELIEFIMELTLREDPIMQGIARGVLNKVGMGR